MSSTCFEPEVSSSGRRLYIQLWYGITCISISSLVGSTVCSNTLFYLKDYLYRCMQSVPYHNCIYNRLPEDEPSGSKHVEDIKKFKIKILFRKCAVRWFILYITMHGVKKNTKNLRE